jgi:hypothetical protein
MVRSIRPKKTCSWYLVRGLKTGRKGYMKPKAMCQILLYRHPKNTSNKKVLKLLFIYLMKMLEVHPFAFAWNAIQ